jgi:hypothetical protein
VIIANASPLLSKSRKSLLHKPYVVIYFRIRGDDDRRCAKSECSIERTRNPLHPPESKTGYIRRAVYQAFRHFTIMDFELSLANIKSERVRYGFPNSPKSLLCILTRLVLIHCLEQGPPISTCLRKYQTSTRTQCIGVCHEGKLLVQPPGW